jgi:hypothetical protein
MSFDVECDVDESHRIENPIFTEECRGFVDTPDAFDALILYGVDDRSENLRPV